MNALALILAKHIDQPLTLALARRIVKEHSQWQPFNPALWAVEHFGPYVFQCERFLDARQELAAQRARYIAETRPGQPNDRTDWDRVIEAQRSGQHVIYTARVNDTGALVGGVWLYVGEDIDSRRQAVTDDILFVNPEHRGGLLGLRLVQYAERCIFAIGVREAIFHFRAENGADRMARYLGYQPVSTRVTKSAPDDAIKVPARRPQEASNDPVI